MTQKRYSKQQNTSNSAKYSFLRLIFPGKTSAEFRQAIKTLKEDVKNFKNKYHGKISELSGKELLKATVEYEKIRENEQNLNSYIYLRSITVEKNQNWVSTTNKKITNIMQDVSFFESEVSNIKEHELLDRILEEPNLSNYTAWLRKIRSYSGVPLAEDETKYLCEQLGSTYNIKNIWQKLANPTPIKRAKNLYDLMHEQDDIKRKSIVKELISDAKTNIETYTQLLHSNIQAKYMLANIHGFQTPKEAWIAKSHADINFLEHVDFATVREIQNIGSKFYQRKAKRKSVPHIGLADLFTVSKTNMDLAKLQKILIAELPKKIDSSVNKEVELLEHCKLANTAITKTPTKVIINGEKITICLGDCDDSDKIIYTAHALGKSLQGEKSKQANSFLQQEPLEAFSEIAGYFAEYLAFDILAENANSTEEKQQILEQQLERNVQILAANSTIIQFSNAIQDKLNTTTEIPTDEINKIWLASMQNSFGSAIDYDTEDISSLWTQFPSIFADTEQSYKQIIGLSIATHLYQSYKNSDNKAEFMQSYQEFLSSGQKKQAKALMQIFAIDINDKKFWQNSLKLIKNNLDKLAKLDKAVSNQKNSPKQPRRRK